MKSLPVASRNSAVTTVSRVVVPPSPFDLPDLTPWERFKDRSRQLMLPFVLIAIVVSVYFAALARSGEDLIKSNATAPSIAALKQMAKEQIADIPTD
jgi:hypothetical protein